MKNSILILLCLISGCAYQKTPFELAQDGPTMKQNYEAHLSGKKPQKNNVMSIGNTDISRNLENDINYFNSVERAYKRLANPEFEMYIYPHRATTHGVIIPGYSVNFPMYDKVQYSLPGDRTDVK